MAELYEFLGVINKVLWHEAVLYTVLFTGILFTFWSLGSQWHSLTHGVAVTLGRYDKADDPGALRPFQALSAALSATVGLGNIGGVALAIGLGGPGAVFWMWVIGAIGMALKSAEVSLSMLYRNVDDPLQPQGGPMYVAREGFKQLGWPRVGKVVGAIFVVTLLISSITGGNMFQAWNVAEVSHQYFGVPKLVVGCILSLIVAAVILGGIKRIGAVAGKLVPFMCALYLVSAIAVVLGNLGEIPAVLRSIFLLAFSPTEAQGAFLGGTAGYAMMWGLKRALFSSEAGQGSSPIAHCAAKTDEPIREGIVAGLEPFIDTLVVCTLTALVILTSGVWKRDVDVAFSEAPKVERAADGWTLATTPMQSEILRAGQDVFTIVRGDANVATDNTQHTLAGTVIERDAVIDGNAGLAIQWKTIEAATAIELHADGIYVQYKGAALTAQAFDRTFDGLGKWLVTIAAWLFAISTMVSWSYYGEQGVIFLFGQRSILGYKLFYCAMIICATVPTWITSDAELDRVTTLGTGVMLWANIPILLVFSGITMKAYRSYRKRMREEG